MHARCCCLLFKYPDTTCLLVKVQALAMQTVAVVGLVLLWSLASFIAGAIFFFANVAHGRTLPHHFPPAKRLRPGPGRREAHIEGDFIVFVIGVQVNNWLAVSQYLPVFKAFPQMVAELVADPDSGLLCHEGYLGNPTTSIQYWRSFEHLERYARDPKRKHQPAWGAYNRALRKAVDKRAMAIFHETYQVKAGCYETMYQGDMEPFGLGAASELREVTAHRSRAALRGKFNVAADAADSTDVKAAKAT
ncbi:hypothetical protein WJX72_010803 [[Myrmecia] bisecta]|uniref:DUF4188 domain-containing protein n=1 Tax=[Myrmecia] bisecta TaxID=41462 RepID=A0AAW1Q756_9CHLO